MCLHHNGLRRKATLHDRPLQFLFQQGSRRQEIRHGGWGGGVLSAPIATPITCIRDGYGALNHIALLKRTACTTERIILLKRLIEI